MELLAFGREFLAQIGKAELAYRNHGGSAAEDLVQPLARIIAKNVVGVRGDTVFDSEESLQPKRRSCRAPGKVHVHVTNAGFPKHRAEPKRFINSSLLVLTSPKRPETLQSFARRAPKARVGRQNRVKLLRKEIDRPDIYERILHGLAGRLVNGEDGKLKSSPVHRLNFTDAKRLAERGEPLEKIRETERSGNRRRHKWLLRRVFILSFPDKGGPFSFNHRPIDRDLGNVVTTWGIEHHIKHDALKQGAQCARTSPLPDGFDRQRPQRILGKGQPNTVHRHEFGILLHHRVLRIGQNHEQLVLGEGVQSADHRQPSDKLRDQSEGKQILRLDGMDRLPRDRVGIPSVTGMKAHRRPTKATLDNLVETDESATANEKNLLGINLDVLLMRMFAAALRRHVADGSFEDFQESLLHTLPGNVACNADILRLASDLIDLINVNDPHLGTLDVVVGILQKPQNDVFDILADIARF